MTKTEAVSHLKKAIEAINVAQTELELVREVFDNKTGLHARLFLADAGSSIQDFAGFVKSK